jgi:hypothetical protein
MTLILILALLVAVYYIAPLARPVQKPGSQPPKEQAASLEAMLGSDALLTPGLVALERALDQYGRGREPLPVEAAVLRRSLPPTPPDAISSK